MKKLLSAVLSLAIIMSCVTIVSADTAQYANILAGMDAESGLSGISVVNAKFDEVVERTNLTAASGNYSYVVNNYPDYTTNDYDIIDISGLSFESGKVYHISFWVKQESTGSGLWPGLRLQLVLPGAGAQDLRNDEDYYMYASTGYSSSNRMALVQDSEWHLKSIIYKSNGNYTGGVLRICGDNNAKYKINLYLDDISVREVPNPEKYVKSDGTTSLFRSSAPYMCNYYRASYRAAAADNAQDIVTSQITLNSAESSDNALTLVFNDAIGAALGECGIETGLIKAGISGATITGTITTSVNAQNGTSTVVIPCEIEDDTVPVKITGLFDIWGKKVSDINIKSIEQSREKGNLLTNAHCEYLGDWSFSGTKTLDTVDKKDNSASFKFSSVAVNGYPMTQNLSVSYIDPEEIVRYSAWIKSSSAITAGAPLRMSLRVSYINDLEQNKNKDLVIGDLVSDGTGWVKTSGILKLSDKWDAYPAQERITGYMIYFINLTGGTISSLNIDNLYFGYDKGLSTRLSGVFFGADNDGGNKNITLAFKSNQSANKSILTADGVNMSKVMLDYYDYDGDTGCTETLNNVCIGSPTVSYDGYYTFIKYNISATEAFEVIEDSVFLVRVEGVDAVDGSSVTVGQLETQKSFNGGLLLSYRTRVYDGEGWSDSNIYDEIENETSTVAILPIIYNASSTAITPIGFCAFYDTGATPELKKVLFCNYGSVASGQIIVGETDGTRFQFGETEMLNPSIRMFWWENDVFRPYAPAITLK